MTRKKFDRALIPPAPDLRFENHCWAKGYQRVAGIDEAGRGALAGPVAAAAVILPWESDYLPEKLNGVRDSKQMTPRQRDHWAKRIQLISVAWGVGFATVQEIDRLGILPATRLAIARAIARLDPTPDHLLVDYLDLPGITLPKISLVKGDARCLSIAAASILAKTARDARLIDLDSRCCGYGFASNKGYGTAQHLASIREKGPTPHHRKTFAPVRELLEKGLQIER